MLRVDAKIGGQGAGGLLAGWGALVGAGREIVTLNRDPAWYSGYAAAMQALDGGALNASAASLVKPEQLMWLVVGDLKKIEADVRALGWGEVVVLQP